jgi:hypothetical protein
MIQAVWHFVGSTRWSAKGTSSVSVRIRYVSYTHKSCTLPSDWLSLRKIHTRRTIHWRDRSKRITLCSRGYFRRDIFLLSKLLKHAKSKNAGYYVDKMKVSWVPTMRCTENCASFRIFATDWIPVKENRRSYSGTTSANQEQSTWKCLQLGYSTNTGLWLHTLWPLLQLPVAVSLLLIQTVQLFSYIPCLYSTEL